ncbi:MAG: transporter substrate-binding domain-containing protein [Calditrichia bacterium]
MRSRKAYFRARNFLLLLLLFVLFAGCRDSREKDPVIQIDLSAIKKRGKLIAITGYSATSYFIYKGQPMGYEYELLTRLAQHFGVELEIKIDNNFVNMFERLNRGEGDLIAYGLTVTQPRKKLVNFTDFLFTTRQVLVQRRPDNWRTMQADDIEKQLLRNPIDLIGKTVYVKKASAYEERLKNLSQEIGGKILIREVGGDTTTEQLIEEVALGNIDFTVSDQHIAMINQAYYSNLDVNTPISLPQRIAWAIRKTSPDLLSEVNNWIEEMKGKTAFYVIYNKYFKNRRAFVRRLK